ncbi:MAG TPA: PAS domain S-box protein [Rubrivivax sp.]|nr:PAS domain S-box protein [Rubrivivax sp.]
MARSFEFAHGLHLGSTWDAAGVGDWEYDHRADCLRLSAATHGRPGKPAEVAELPLSAWLDCIHGADRPAVEACLSDAAHSEGLSSVAFRYIWPDGHWSWIEVRGAVTERDAHGKALRSAGLRLDITRQRNAEVLLALQHDFTRVLAGAPDSRELGKAMLDMALGLPELDGGGLYWRLEDGSYTLGEHRGLSADFVTEVHHLAAGTSRTRLIEAGAMVCSSVEGHAQRRGELLDRPEVAREGIRALVVLPIAVEGRSVACLNLASRNLTTLPRPTVQALESMALQFGLALERARARDEAGQRKRNLEGFMTALRDYVFVLDAASNIVYASPSVREGLGYGDELLGRSVLSLHAPALRASAAAIVGEMLAGRRDTCPLPIQRADGSEVHVDTRIVRGHWNGQPALIGISRDVSEERARRLERESEAERRRVLMDRSRDGIAIIDQEHRIVEANQRFAEMLGYASAELTGLHTWDFEACMDEAHVRAHFADVSAIDATFETRHRRRDGSQYDAEVSASGALIDGRPVVITVTRDISEHKRAQAALAASEERYRILADYSPDWQYWIGPDGRFIYVSPSSLQICGHAPAAFLADAGLMESIVHPEDRRLWHRHLHGLCGDQPHHSHAALELRIHHADGRERWIEHQCQPTFSAQGVFQGRRGVNRDITDRKQAEAELLRYRARLEELVSERTAAMEAANRQLTLSDQRLNAMFAMSQAASELTEQQLLQRGIDEAARLTQSEIGYLHFINDDQETIRLAAWSTGTYRFCTAAYDDHYPVSQAGVWADSVRTLGPVVHNDYQGMAGRRGYPEGHAHLLRHLGVPVIEQGQVRMLLGVGNKAVDYNESDAQQLQLIGTDLWHIFKRRRTEIQLAEAKQAAEAANVAKSAFLANMSHEIRTPLNAIAGMTHLVRRAGVTPEQAERLAKIDAASGHLLEIINAVLDLSKIEAGKFELEQSPVMLATVFSNVVSMLSAKALAKGLRLQVEPLPVTEPLLGDATRLQQALLNYAANAVKFTAAGHVLLRVRRLAQTGEQVSLRFEVEDTGIGVEPERLARLFSAFEQADNTISRQYGGTGLGLAITRKLAELMGGSAGASSVPGQGSTFWFTATLRQAAGRQLAAPRIKGDEALARLRRHQGKKRVLLVEDDAVSREVGLMLLEEAGLVAESAVDGQQAVALAAQSHFDLILMDMQMPVMDGLQATRGIRALPGHASTPIVAMTANAFAEDRLLCQQAGMDDFVTKPIEPAVLFGTLLAWLERPAPS